MAVATVEEQEEQQEEEVVVVVPLAMVEATAIHLLEVLPTLGGKHRPNIIPRARFPTSPQHCSLTDVLRAYAPLLRTTFD